LQSFTANRTFSNAMLGNISIRREMASSNSHSAHAAGLSAVHYGAERGGH
jgi:hypothetical protein